MSMLWLRLDWVTSGFRSENIFRKRVHLLPQAWQCNMSILSSSHNIYNVLLIMNFIIILLLTRQWTSITHQMLILIVAGNKDIITYWSTIRYFVRLLDVRLKMELCVFFCGPWFGHSSREPNFWILTTICH